MPFIDPTPLLLTASGGAAHSFVEALDGELEVLRGLARTLGAQPLDCDWDETAELWLAILHRIIGSAGSLGLSPIQRSAEVLHRLIEQSFSRRGTLQLEELSALLNRLAEDIGHARKLLAQQTRDARGGEQTQVLILDDELVSTWRLRQTLEAHGLAVRACVDVPGLRARLAEPVALDLLLINPRLPEGADSVWAVVERALASAARRPALLVICDLDDLGTRLDALRRGAAAILPRGCSPEGVLRAIQQLIEPATLSQPHRLLAVLDSDDSRRRLLAALDPGRFELHCCLCASEGLQLLTSFAPDVVLISTQLGECSGAELAQLTRLQSDGEPAPLLYLTSGADAAVSTAGLHEGEPCLPISIDANSLAAALAARARHGRTRALMADSLAQLRYEREREHQALNAHAIVSVADGRGRIVYVNERFCAISGYYPQELVGANHRVIKSDQHDREFYRQMWRTISRGGIWQGEICNQRRDGSRYWVASTIVPFLDGRGRPYRYVSIRTDITEVKAMVRTAQANEERLRRSQVYANIGTWDWNIRSGELFWSERIAPLFGFAEGALETSYENFLSAVHPDDRQAVIDAVDACVHHGIDYSIEHRCIWPDGSVHWLLERGDVVRDAAGAALHMLGVVQDITQRKQAELALEESRQRLLQAQALARLGHWEADLLSGALHWSDVIYSIFGEDPRHFEPTIERFFAAVHEDDRSAVQAAQQAAWQSGRLDIVHRIRRPDGEVRYVRELAELQRRDDGGAWLAGTVQDVSDLKRIEEALRQATLEAESANRAKSEFLASMSHELRTPLNAIIGFGQLLESDPRLSVEAQDSAQEILKAGAHLLTLINEVLDLARIEAGKLSLTLEQICLTSALSECVSLLTPLAKQHGIDLQIGPVATASLWLDRTRLKQVLLNLVGNAIKYNRAHGTVRIEAVRTEAGVRIDIADSGPGIPANRLNELFEPFARLGAERSATEGSGIGLAITRRLLDSMNGTISVRSRIGEGSVFSVQLPCSKTPAMPLAPTAQPQSAAIRWPQEPSVVLYVEDNPANLKLVQLALADVPSLRLLAAGNTQQAITLGASDPPDLILLDMHLPDGDGLQWLRTLRAQSWGRQVPVIVLSANGMADRVAAAQSAGVFAYLVKPLDIAALRSRVAEALAAATTDPERMASRPHPLPEERDHAQSG